MPLSGGRTLDVPELPSLEPGITLLAAERNHPTVPLQTLAIDRVLTDGGVGVWAGVGRYCRTDSLCDLAPSRRVLDRLSVARGFQAYQHTALLRRLDAAVDADTPAVVAPAVDLHYRDGVQGGDGRDLLVRNLATLARLARDYEVPVLVTRHRDDEFAAPVANAADRTVEYRETRAGPRFAGEEFETLVYDLGDGWVQTTLAFWQDVLQAREPLHVPASAVGEAMVRG